MKRFAAVLLGFMIMISLSGCGRMNAGPEDPDIPVASEDFVPAELLDDPIKHTAENTVIDPGIINDNANDSNDAADDPHEDSETAPHYPGRNFINVYWATEELYQIVMRYKELHPDFPYEIRTKELSVLPDEYYPALDKLLEADNDDMPDIYCIESSYVKAYTQGDKSRYAATYKELGLDVDNLLKKADIPQYVIDMGTNADGEVVALGYLGTGGAFIYRRSIAKDVWGTDNPEIIKSKIGPGWDRFFKAAAELKNKGYAIVSGYNDVWYCVEGSAEKPWVIDGKLYIDPAREAFLDIAKRLYDNEYINHTIPWRDDWFADMMDTGPKKVFGYFGPAWLINYVIKNSCGGEKPGEGTYGDWAVCEPPAGFFWGGNWIFVNKHSPFKEDLARLVEWITLDCSENGFQYAWASGTFPGNYGYLEAVPSGTVMRNVSGVMDFLGNQDMFDMLDKCARLANGRNKSPYDETINYHWLTAVRTYVEGWKTRERAIADFKRAVENELGIKAE